jgi:hypothetical protein
MQKDESNKLADEAAAPGDVLHKPPSMLWFVIPLGLLVLYALLTR